MVSSDFGECRRVGFARRRVIYAHPDHDSERSAMKFRLTYEGRLYSPNDRERMADHKHEIRRYLHPQLRHLWNTHAYLSKAQKSDRMMGATRVNLRDWLADEFQLLGYSFVPLVTKSLSLSCSIDILHLRPSAPGALINNNGDIDNRLKTLFDALRRPDRKQELGSYAIPLPDEDPFFCLLEDDKLITQVSVETDALLKPGMMDINDAMLIITITLSPYGDIGWDNIPFVG